MEIHERVWRYSERKFQKSGKTKFPTVAQVARALKIKQADVEQACEDSELLMLTSYNVRPEDPLGEHFVETFEPRPS
jgi:hypothetical protein